MQAGLEGVALPHVLHATIEDEKRTIIVGDIHGCFDELQELLQLCMWRPEDGDRLILVGDLMSKGPKPLEVLRFAQQTNIWCIRGNHDDAALKAYYALRNLTKAERKQHDLMVYFAYTIHFTKKDVQFLEQLPYTIHLAHCDAIVVHAGLVPNTPLSQQQPFDMYKMRNVVEVTDAEDSQAAAAAATFTTYRGTESTKEGVPWASKWNGPEYVYFGHDAKRGLQHWPFATGLDTGCCYGKQLTAIILPDRTLVSTPAQKVYSKPVEKNP